MCGALDQRLVLSHISLSYSILGRDNDYWIHTYWSLHYPNNNWHFLVPHMAFEDMYPGNYSTAQESDRDYPNNNTG